MSNNIDQLQLYFRQPWTDEHVQHFKEVHSMIKEHIETYKSYQATLVARQHLITWFLDQPWIVRLRHQSLLEALIKNFRLVRHHATEDGIHVHISFPKHGSFSIHFVSRKDKVAIFVTSAIGEEKGYWAHTAGREREMPDFGSIRAQLPRSLHCLTRFEQVVLVTIFAQYYQPALTSMPLGPNQPLTLDMLLTMPMED
jgi:hypothetical protein